MYWYKKHYKKYVDDILMLLQLYSGTDTFTRIEYRNTKVPTCEHNTLMGSLKYKQLWKTAFSLMASKNVPKIFDGF